MATPHIPAVLQFLGAAGTVSGSRFLIEVGDSTVLVDVGLFQGLKAHRLQNWDPFPVDPSQIDAVVLTHAHIDHSGYLPALVRHGFSGAVHSTVRTRDLCSVLLADSAHLQEEEARYANKHGFSKHKPARPLYDADDARTAMQQFRISEFGVAAEVTPEVSVTFLPAGHILGSSSILLELRSSPPRRLLVSGDLGRAGHPILVDPAAPPQADVVLLESTYGDRRHPDPTEEVDALAAAITETAERGGMVLVPAFAVDRTEVVLALLRDLMEQGRIPRLPVHADSPMALRVLDLYRRAAEDGDADVRPITPPVSFDPGGGLHECHTPDESRALNELTYPSIIVSASGMATGGRVLHHLARLLPDGRNLVVLTGFQAAGTRGRSLVDGATTVKLLGRYVPVRASVIQMDSLSVHADADELCTWLQSMPAAPDVVYVVHGEPNASAALALRLPEVCDTMAVVPRAGERVLL